MMETGRFTVTQDYFVRASKVWKVKMSTIAFVKKRKSTSHKGLSIPLSGIFSPKKRLMKVKSSGVYTDAADASGQVH